MYWRKEVKKISFTQSRLYLFGWMLLWRYNWLLIASLNMRRWRRWRRWRKKRRIKRKKKGWKEKKRFN